MYISDSRKPFSDTCTIVTWVDKTCTVNNFVNFYDERKRAAHPYIGDEQSMEVPSGYLTDLILSRPDGKDALWSALMLGEFDTCRIVRNDDGEYVFQESMVDNPDEDDWEDYATIREKDFRPIRDYIAENAAWNELIDVLSDCAVTIVPLTYNGWELRIDNHNVIGFAYILNDEPDAMDEIERYVAEWNTYLAD